LMPWGQCIGIDNATHLKMERESTLAGAAVFSPRLTWKASLRWQIIWATVILPQRRWLATPTAESRSSISCLSAGLARVFKVDLADSIGRRHRFKESQSCRYLWKLPR
jgi:hypothetical protein